MIMMVKGDDTDDDEDNMKSKCGSCGSYAAIAAVKDRRGAQARIKYENSKLCEFFMICITESMSAHYVWVCSANDLSHIE